MKKQKCVSCGTEFEANKEEQTIKVILNNPGEVFVKGQVVTCPSCKCQTAEGEDIKQILTDFDKAYEEKHKNFKKVLAYSK